MLEGAAQLFAERPGARVTMEEIAAAAGVGKGTLYRRYPNVASIAVALLDEHERRLQEEIVRGKPPLGPGAAPAARLVAFYSAMTELLERHGHLALAAETGAHRYLTGAYRAWTTHLALLLDEAGLGAQEALVDVLLAPLAPDVYAHQRKRLTRQQIANSLAILARRILQAAGGQPPRAEAS